MSKFFLNLMFFSLKQKTFKFTGSLLFKDDIAVENIQIDEVSSGLYLFVAERSLTPTKDNSIGIYETFTGLLVRRLRSDELSFNPNSILTFLYDARYLISGG